MIELDNVTVVYDNGVHGLREFSLTINAGEFVFVTGPTGEGKTTLLRTIYREVMPRQGTVKVAGRDITRLRDGQLTVLRRRLGVVFQDFRLLPDRTVEENLAFALAAAGSGSRQVGRRIAELLSLVGLFEIRERFPAQLSAGEQQRVCIARSLIHNPPIVLADEPTGNLDPETSWGIVEVFQRINAEQGSTVVITSHDEAVVTRAQRRVCRIEGGRLVRDDQAAGYRA